jgi:hypothetical protein
MSKSTSELLVFMLFVFGVPAVIMGALYVLMEVLPARRPQCHDCGWALKPLHLHALPLNDTGHTDVPPGATWYCPHCRPVRYYGNGAGVGVEKGVTIDEL